MFNPADRAGPPVRRFRDRTILFATILMAIAFIGGMSVLRGDSPEAPRAVVPASSDAAVTISEFVAANVGGLRDEDRDSPSWIEVHNRGPENVNLAGWGLTDEKNHWDKWTFPDMTLASGGYRVVFASGKDRRSPDGALHTNFRLDADGEFLALYTPDARPQPDSLFMPRYPRQAGNIAFGRDTAGRLAYLDPPTPGAAPFDVRTYAGVAAPVRFSATRGVYEDAQSLELATATSEATIWYTLDGSPPEPSKALRYQRGIPITDSTVVRAMATRAEFVASEETAHTFVFPEKVPEQTRPEGYPETWGEGLPADYAMEPGLSQQQRDRVADALRDLPTLSIATSPDDLFGEARGMYMNTERDGVAWERPASVEFFDSSSGTEFHTPAGIRIQGRSSRKPATSPKHSFRLLFKSEYGAGTLRFPVFNGAGPGAYETLVLRATSNHSWTFPLGEQRLRAQYVRDPWAKDTQRAMGHFAAHSRYIHLYLNGLYWGLYAIGERPDAAFMESRTGVPAESFDVHKGGEVVDGDDHAWRRLFSLVERGVESETEWERLESYLDVDSFIDFMVLNHYAGNTNWDYGNWYAARDRTGDTGFRFFVWDMESILGRVGENVLYVRNVNRPTELFHRLRENPRFRSRFAARIDALLTRDGPLTPKAASDRFLARATTIENAIVAEAARWGDYRLTAHRYRTGPYTRYTRDDHWRSEQRRLLLEYFPARADIVLEQYARAELIGN